jgi:hypothetical protein
VSECQGQFEQCQRQFDAIHAKLDRLDEAIRGNGRPGISVRLDRLEQNAQRHGKLIWLILGTGVSVVGSLIITWLGGCSS